MESNLSLSLREAYSSYDARNRLAKGNTAKRTIILGRCHNPTELVESLPC
jgi:hypothetical protein